MPVPDISVVVPYGTDRLTIWECIHSLKAQTLRDNEYEIIIVDDGENLLYRDVDKLRNMCVTVLQKSKFGVSSARNLGISNARGRLIVMIDDDCVADRNLLAEYKAYFTENSEIDYAGGIVNSVEQVGLYAAYSKYRGLLSTPVMAEGVVVSVITANCCIRCEVVEKVGGFEECLDDCLGGCGGEDADLSYRIRNFGYKMGFCSKAVVAHYHRTTFYSFIQQQTRVGAGLVVHALIRNRAMSDIGLPAPTHYFCFIHLIRFLYTSNSISGVSLIRRIISYSKDKQLPLLSKVSFPVVDLIRRISYLIGIISGKRRYTRWIGTNEMDFK